jgi:hypothetical protein
MIFFWQFLIEAGGRAKILSRARIALTKLRVKFPRPRRGLWRKVAEIKVESNGEAMGDRR